MSPDEQHKLYTQGFEAGQKHSNPSEDTKEFMKETNEKFEEVRKSLSKINELMYKMDLKLESIVVQTTKTNGRVGKLEDWRVEVKPIVDKLNDEYRDNTQSKKNLTQNLKEFGIIEVLKVVSFLVLAGLVVYFR